jgi:hypothetical protein
MKDFNIYLTKIKVHGVNLLFSCLLSNNIKSLKYTELQLYQLFCMVGTWFLTLWEEHRLRVFENRALRKILEPIMDEVAGDWRKLHVEELCNLYFLRKIKSKRTGWVGHVVHMGEVRNAYRIVVGKPLGMRSLGRQAFMEGLLKWIVRQVGGKVWTVLIWL